MFYLYIYVVIICSRYLLVIGPSFMYSFYVLVVVWTTCMYYVYVLFICTSYIFMY